MENFVMMMKQDKRLAMACGKKHDILCAIPFLFVGKNENSLTHMLQLRSNAAK